MQISDAMKVLDVSRTTMVKWLEDGRFPGAKRDKSVRTAPWYIPAEDVETVRQELISELESQMKRIATPATDRYDVDFVELER